MFLYDQNSGTMYKFLKPFRGRAFGSNCYATTVHSSALFGPPRTLCSLLSSALIRSRGYTSITPANNEGSKIDIFKRIGTLGLHHHLHCKKITEIYKAHHVKVILLPTYKILINRYLHIFIQTSIQEIILRYLYQKSFSTITLIISQFVRSLSSWNLEQYFYNLLSVFVTLFSSALRKLNPKEIGFSTSLRPRYFSASNYLEFYLKSR